MPDNHVRVQRSGGRYYLVDTYGTRILEYTRSPSRALAVSRFKTTGTLQSESLRIHKSRIESGLSYIKGTTSVLTLTNTTDADDKFTISVGTDGATTIATNDDAGRGADLTLDADGEIEINADEGIISFKDDSAVLAKITTSGLDFTDNIGAKITFEGDTDNDHQTILAVTDPTADRTITFPDSTGTVALTSDITTSLSFDGSTANGVCTYKDADEISVESTLTYDSNTLSMGGDDEVLFQIERKRHTDGGGGELRIVGGDATDGALNMAGGNVSLYGGRGTGAVFGGSIDFYSSTRGSSGTTLNPISKLVSVEPTTSETVINIYEKSGISTDDYFKIKVAEHGATTLQTWDASATQADLTLDADGDIEINAEGGDIDFKDGSAQLAKISTDGLSFENNTGAGIIFDGATNDAHMTTLSVIDPTGTRAINLPDSSGTVALTSDITSDGWHGSTTRIKILPRDFVANDIGRPLMIEDDAVGSNELFLHSFGSGDMFAYIPIPTGYKATHVRIYGSDTGQNFYVYEGDINSKTITDIATGTTAIGTEKTLGTELTSDTTNYLLVRVTSDGSTDEIHGGYVTIAAV